MIFLKPHLFLIHLINGTVLGRAIATGVTTGTANKSI